MNPGFDEKTGCPASLMTSFDLVEGWDRVENHYGTADFLSYCSSNNSLKLPNSGFGFENSKSDSSYIGLEIFNIGYTNLEYIQTKLIDSLKVNQDYKLSFYYSLSDYSSLSTNDLGFLFSKNKIIGDGVNTLPINKTPTIKTSNHLNISDGWTKITLTFKADSAFKYLTVGNFSNTLASQTIELNQGIRMSSYIFLEDFELIPINCDTTNQSLELCTDSILTLQAMDDGESYYWSTGESTKEIIISEEKKYAVYTNEITCTSLNIFQVESVQCIIEETNQNIITPNGDGINDNFQIINPGINTIKNYRLSIFNRWGIKVFDSEVLNEKWSGKTVDGRFLNQGVYYYTFQYAIENKPIQYKNGFVQLIR